ncbi:MAG: abortive infection system antitoxin AbiGi family protein [bacterium]
MNLHSDILVHWTGRDFKQPPEYIERLQAFYKDGIYAHPPKIVEKICGFNTEVVLRSIPMICFTEIRLSQAKTFADRYGKLGIGFSRKYLMDRGANPVFYLRSSKNGIVNTNFAYLFHMAEENGILNTFLAYCKSMSSEPDKELDFYEEMEWRTIVCELKDSSPPCPHLTKKGEYYYLDFNPSDVELIVFPDEIIKKAALEDPSMVEYFRQHTPMIVTCDKIPNF